MKIAAGEGLAVLGALVTGLLLAEAVHKFLPYGCGQPNGMDVHENT